jgi:hypothetical protein
MDPDPGGQKHADPDPVPDPQHQGCGSGSGSGLDLDSIGSVDPDSESGSGSGSRRAKMTHKSRQKFVKVHVLKCWMASFVKFVNFNKFMEKCV